MKGLQLLATGGALPGRVVTNEDLSRQGDTSDEWITTRTGIRQRYYCTESEDAATLAIAAARQALARSGLAASEIACCVAATLSAPTATPSVACRVQAALGLPENRPAFDVNAACSGFIYAIAAAHGLLNTLGGRYALVIGCEALSHMVDPTDRTTCVLFGDGAGAAILELAEDVPFAVTLGARGSEAIRVGGPAACDTAPITMDGKAVFRFAVETMPRCLQTVLERSQKTLDDLDWVVCHQANSRIIDHCIKHLHAEPSKFYKNMDRHGNTSAASIPIALHEMVENDLKINYRDDEIATLDVSTFTSAYNTMLIRIKKSYPKSRIICILPYYTSEYEAKDSQITQMVDMDRTDTYDEIIKQICALHRVSYVDLREAGIPKCSYKKYLPDNLHPNPKGMEIIFEEVNKMF